MIRSEIIAKLAAHFTDLPEQTVNEAVSKLVDFMRQQIAEGQRIEVRDFGAFDLRYRPPRNVSDPRTQAHHHIEARYVAHFRAGQELREAVQTGLDKGLPIRDE